MRQNDNLFDEWLFSLGETEFSGNNLTLDDQQIELFSGFDAIWFVLKQVLHCHQKISR